MTTNSGSTKDKKRHLQVTAGNIRQSHLYIHGNYDFFPSDCIGGPKRSAESRTIDIYLDGLNRTVQTDIGRDARTGRPRGFFRGRGWVREFFRFHRVKPGVSLSLERVSERRYRLSVRPSENRFTLNSAEFFAGIGLVRFALERQGWQIDFANDIDVKKAKIYRDNWPTDDHLVLGDIHDLEPDQVPNCTLFTASFPCNDLSIAGRWEGLEGKESSSFWGFMRIVGSLGDRRPQVILLENVVGFLMSRGGRDFEKALLALNELDYNVDAMILNAVHWVPQSRPRLFVIAKRDAHGLRQSYCLQSDARPKALYRFIVDHPNVRWDIASVPPLPPPRSRLADIIEDLPDDDPYWWNRKRAKYFMNQMSAKHAALAQEMIASDSYTFATAFRRVRHKRSMAELRTDGIAGCLRTPRGGSGRQILFKAGRGEYRVRLLTARECARLQGVPDSFVIQVPLNQALFGFGDAVCVPVVEWILKHCVNPLAMPESGKRNGSRVRLTLEC